MFEKTQRKKSKLRLGLVGTAGSGKTYSALKIAKGLGGKIAVIDTENGSADLYANLCDYNVCTLQAPYEVNKYIQAIDYAEKNGYNTIIIDSLSHAWAGEGGLLDLQGKIADSGKSGVNSYTAWRSVTPLHNKLIENILTSKCHIIATMRAKTDYVMEKDDNTNRTIIKKVGLAPIQREGMDYEFTLVFDLNSNHMAQASKDRTGLFANKLPVNLDENTGRLLNEWLNSGIDIPLISEEQEKKLDELEVDKKALCDYYKVTNLKDLTFLQAQKAIEMKEKRQLSNI
jgi:hypothetical protein